MKVYGVPFMSPPTEQLVPDVVHVPSPGEARAVYEVIGPPVLGGDQLMVAEPLPGTAEGEVGADGRTAGVAEAGLDEGPVPTAFAAVTVKL
jgi:hypothetical protein